MSKRRTLVRRALVTGALAASLVVGGSGAAMAANGQHGTRSCARAAHEIARIEQKLASLANSSRPGGGDNGGKLAARQAKAEKKLAALKAACPS